ncbi:MAG: DUF11 domain-containing protein [Leadbetterella sp.]|nr:DUF11 domain-containing protein [Leadbetterella sp.]
MITYSFKVKNTGNVTLTNVTVTDPLSGLRAITPASVAVLAPGAETTFTASYTVTQSDVNNGKVHNTATAKGTPPTGDDIEDDDEEDVPFDSTPGIELIKSGVYEDADGNGKVNPGDKINYTFTVTNKGNVTLTNVTVTDPKVTVIGGPIASLAPGAVDNTTFTATYIILQSDINAGQVDNTARATGKDPKGKDVSDDDDETVELGQIFDLALRKTTKPGQLTVFKPGDKVTFEITVFNQGNIDATDIDLVDYIPTGLTLSDANWTLSGNKARWNGAIASLTVGAQATVEITFTLNNDAIGPVITNIAEISGAKNKKGVADIDSTPDDNKDNDGTAKNDEINENGKKGGDEDDHDIEPINVCPDQKCLTAKVKVNRANK